MQERPPSLMKKAALLSLILFFIVLVTVPVLAIFPLFLFVYSIHSRIQVNPNNFYRKYIFLGLLFGLFTEGLAILDNLDSPPEERILFHPDAGIDLLLGVGFYFFIAVVWSVLVKKYAFTERSIFVIGGIWGIVVEQDLAILLSPLTYGAAGFVMYLFVFLVYGPFMAIPVLFFRDLSTLERKQRKFHHAVLAFLALFGAYIMAGMYMVFIYYVLHLLLE